MKLKTFPSRLHHRRWMRWHDTCRTYVDCVSRVSVSSVLLAVEILRKNKKASQVKCHQIPFWLVSVFFGVVGKNPSTKDIPGSALSATVVHKTLKILPRGVNLCWRKLSHFNDRAGQCRVVWFTTQFFYFGQGQSTPYYNRESNSVIYRITGETQ